MLVLWILVIISFLSSEYVAHNRHKAAIALHTTELFQQEAAEFSVLELFASSQYDLLATEAQEENADAQIKADSATDTTDNTQKRAVPWIRLRPGGVEVWVKIEDESSRIHLSLEQENGIRTALYSIYGQEQKQEAEIFTDALLDWLDPDDLLRPNGAEKVYYGGLDPPSNPGNGPLKSMAQISMVKGFSPAIFWSDPYEYLFELPIYSGLAESYKLAHKATDNSSSQDKKRSEKEKDVADNEKITSILEQFTIYPEEYIRVSMLLPRDGDRWQNELFWIIKDGSSFKLSEQLSRVMIAHIAQYEN